MALWLGFQAFTFMAQVQSQLRNWDPTQCGQKKRKKKKIDQFVALRISNLTLGGGNGRKGWKNSEAATLKPLDTCGERGSRPSSCVPGLGMTLRQSDLTHQCKADCRDVLVDSWPVMQYNKHPPESQWLWTSSVSFPHVSVGQFWV